MGGHRAWGEWEGDSGIVSVVGTGEQSPEPKALLLYPPLGREPPFCLVSSSVDLTWCVY